MSESLYERLAGFHSRLWPSTIETIAWIANHDQPTASMLDGVVSSIVNGIVVDGAKVRADVAPLLPATERVVAQLCSEPPPLGTYALSPITLLGSLAATGVAIPDASIAAARTAVVEVKTDRNEDAADHWLKAAIAIAVDAPIGYRGMLGIKKEEPPAFESGATFGANVQGTLRHFATALKVGAPFADCEPAWTELLHYFRELQGATMFRLDGLLWTAWTVRHHIAGQPIGTVADFLHDQVRTHVT